MSRKKRILWCGEACFLSTGFSTYSLEVLRRLHDSGKYDLMEYASYSPPGDPRASDLPWKHMSAMPEPGNEQEKQAYASNPLNEFGEMKFEEACIRHRPDVTIDTRDWWMCVGRNTPIHTHSGPKPIQDIEVNDTVLTHTGRYRRVSHVFPERTHTGTFVRLKASNLALPVTVTDEHPVLAYRRGHKERYLPDLETIKTEWVRADSLREGDLLCLPVPPEGASSLFEDIARLAGYYAAEGCLMYEGKKAYGKIKGAQFTFNISEWGLVNDLCELSERVFGVKPTVNKLSKQNALVVRIFSAAAGSKLSQLVPGKAATKRMSALLYQARTESLVQFLTGLFRGDGSFNEETLRCNYTTKSRDLALQVFMCCLRLGVLPALSHGTTRLRGQAYNRYQISFAGDAALGFASIWNGKKPAVRSKRIVNGTAYLTLKQVEHYQGSEPVYNFEVEEDNSYVSCFALHNCEYQERSPLRPYYHWCLMPTVDAEPQDEQWLATYLNADSVFAYSDWGLDVLRRESQGRIRTVCSTPPGADLATYEVKLDRRGHRQAMGLDPDVLIVGTVMRNQRRKLYPELLEAFARFRAQAPADLGEKTYLYLHTAWPDVGWDIPRLVKEAGLSSRTLFTYHCQSCGAVFPSFFSDSKTFCRACGKPTATFPGTQNGVSRKALCDILNLFDVYVQYANSEGFGMPQVEAAACGIPVMATDYSAMSDVVRKLGGIPIRPLCLIREPETHCKRAIPDQDHFVSELIRFLRMPEVARARQRLEVRRAVEEHYSWDQTARRWMDRLDTIEVRDETQTWLAPARLHTPAETVPEGLSNADFVRWGMAHVAGRPDLVSSYMALRLTRDLNWGVTLGQGMGGIYFNEASTLGTRPRYAPMTRDHVLAIFRDMAGKRNRWEKERTRRCRG